MELVVNITKRVATIQQGDMLPICGNTGDTVKFVFDEEWNDHDQKTARFIWRGMHKDVEFTGDTCDVPPISNTQALLVGVYAGELAEDGYMLSTTLVSIKYERSTRCVETQANPSSGQNYTNEAKGYAIEAKAAATEAKAAADGLDEYKAAVINHEERLVAIEEYVLPGEPVELTAKATEEMQAPSGARQYAQIKEIKGGYEAIFTGYYFLRSYGITTIKANGEILLDLSNVNLTDYGLYTNRIVFENGKAYYYQEVRLDYYGYEIGDGEEIIAEFCDNHQLVKLAETIITDITSIIGDGIIEIPQDTTVTITTTTEKSQVSEEYTQDATNIKPPEVEPEFTIIFEV